MKKLLQTDFNFSKRLKWVGLTLIWLGFQQIQAQNCQPQLILQNQTVSSGQVIIQKAAQSINAAGNGTTYLIYNNGKAAFQAGNEIVLKDGFHAYTGGEFNAVLQACSNAPNDPYFYLQWGHHNTGNVPRFSDNLPTGVSGMDTKILDTWNITRGSSNIVIAIIDSGLDIGHPDIDANRIYQPYNFINNNTDVSDYLGHGTMVAGIIAATVNNGEGLAGIDQFCKIMPLKVSPSNSSQVAAALRYAADRGAKIASMSFGNEAESSQEVKNAIGYAIGKGVIIIASAGNDNRNTVDYPSRLSEVISVGSANPCGTRKAAVSKNNAGSCDQDYRAETGIPTDPNALGWGSNYGVGLDLLAPGVLLPTTDMRGTAGYSSGSIYKSSSDGNYILNLLGTSFAGPFVAGVTSLMLAVNPNLKAYQVDYILKATATNLSDGHKMVNAYAAVQMAQNFANSYTLGDWEVSLSTPAQITNGDNFTATIQVKNNGERTIPAATLNYQLRLLDNTTQSGTLNIPALAIGQRISFNIPLYVYVNCQEVPYLHFPLNAEFRANINPTVSESNTLNNLATSTITVNDKLPDLTPIKAEIYYIKSGIIVNYLLYNASKGNINYLGFNDMVINYWASKDAAYDASDIYLGNKNFGRSFNLCGEDYIRIESDGLSISAAYIIIQVDVQNAIEETNEQNNFLAVPLYIEDTIEIPIDIPVDTPIGIPIEISIDDTAYQREIKPSVLTDFGIYPNPAQDIITLQYSAQTTGKITITDMLGRIKMETMPEANHYQMDIDISRYELGIYFIHFQDKSGKSYLKKFVKK